MTGGLGLLFSSREKANGGVMAVFVHVRSCNRQEKSDLFSMSTLAGQKVTGVFCHGIFQQGTLCL